MVRSSSERSHSSSKKQNKQTASPVVSTNSFPRPSLSAVLSVLFVAYISHSLWNIYKIYYPSPCPPSAKCMKPAWTENTKFQVAAFTSVSKSERNLKLIWSKNEVDMQLPFEVQLNVSLPKETLRNGSLYLHIFLCESKITGEVTSLSQFNSENTSSKFAHLTKYLVPKTKAFNLLGSEEDVNSGSPKPETAMADSNRPIAHWIPRLSVHGMLEPLPLLGVPQEMYPYISFNKKKMYLPMMYIDHFGLLEKDFIPMNTSSNIMPLTLSYVPVSFGKMRLIVVIEQSLKILENAGFSDKETDDVKSIFFDTNIYLLFVTFIISGFHLLFDMLAFKNDISFWRNRKSIVGLSFRSLMWRCISQSIVFVYLYDQGTSLIILVPAGVAIIIEIWKVTKALKLNVYWYRWCFKFEFGTSSEEEKQSDAYDSQGMKYLMWFILPCCLLYACYSLLYIQHTSWFSWCLESVVSGVYAFGFIFMLPQLFVNYKLKSVDHLPWKVFMYKAFNTVVDDLFAFIITMPTAHRIACFRDDIVFIVYLYQRWLYPVDKSRVTEYGGPSGNQEKKHKKD